jgi:hypothetical protein
MRLQSRLLLVKKNRSLAHANRFGAHANRFGARGDVFGDNGVCSDLGVVTDNYVT